MSNETKQYISEAIEAAKSNVTGCRNLVWDNRAIGIMLPYAENYRDGANKYAEVGGEHGVIIVEWYRPEAHDDDDLSFTGFSLKHRGGRVRVKKVLPLTAIEEACEIQALK